MSDRRTRKHNAEKKTSQSLATLRVASDFEVVPPVLQGPPSGHGLISADL